MGLRACLLAYHRIARPLFDAAELAQGFEAQIELLDEGKITAAESAELLNALGSAHPAPGVAGSHRAKLQQTAVLGVVLVMIEFFLPWFTIHPGREAARAIAQMREAMGNLLAIAGNLPALATGHPLHIAGGQVGHGMRWLILATGVAAIVVPLLQLKLDLQTQRLVVWAALGIGGFLLLYLLTQAFRFVSIGLFVVLAGYTLEALGLARERSA